MKTLFLHCKCGNTQLFRGVDAQAILAKIDVASWVDEPSTDGKCGKGHAPGICPACYEALDAALDACDGDIELEDPED